MLTVEKLSLSDSLLRWWKKNGRMYPWRETTDPYLVLVAEVMLHRTRADQVLPVYETFVKRFPDISSLANASREDILKILRPLGLKWRIDLLQEMALKIVHETGGKIIPDKDWLKSLPGVSEYIASAVMCFAFKKPEPLLDTNTVRIIGRLYNIPVNDSSRRSKKFKKIYADLMDAERAREFNMAMIDLGAMVCKARLPLCENCPLRNHCRYYINHKVGGCAKSLFPIW